MKRIAYDYRDQACFILKIKDAFSGSLQPNLLMIREKEAHIN